MSFAGPRLPLSNHVSTETGSCSFTNLAFAVDSLVLPGDLRAYSILQEERKRRRYVGKSHASNTVASSGPFAPRTQLLGFCFPW